MSINGFVVGCSGDVLALSEYDIFYMYFSGGGGGKKASSDHMQNHI